MTSIDRFYVPKVKDFMTRKVISFTSDMDIGEVLKVFNKYRISSGPVLESENSKEVIGFISEDDIMEAMAESSFFHSPSLPVKVSDIMSHQVHTLNLEMDVFEVEKIFRENKLRHAPVIDDFHNQIGLVSRRDILRSLEKLYDEMGEYNKKVKAPRDFSMIDEVKWKLGL